MNGTSHPPSALSRDLRRWAGRSVALVGLIALVACGGGGAPEEAGGGQADQASAPLGERLEATRASEALMERAAEIWDRKCIACHGARGGGGVGPNLTDRYWLHGASPAQVRRSIAKGFPMQGMIAYEQDLASAEIDALLAYVLDMQGTDPPNAMPPQGERVE